MKKIIWILTIVIAVVFFDQSSKYWALSSLNEEFPRPLLPFLQFRLALNHGVAFSLFHNKGLEAPWMLMLLTGGLSLFILWMLYQTPSHKKSEVVALSFILGGAMGNFMDRFRLGAVLDFIDAFIGVHHWPTFNIADCFICIGACILIISNFKTNHSSSV